MTRPRLSVLAAVLGASAMGAPAAPALAQLPAAPPPEPSAPLGLARPTAAPGFWHRAWDFSRHQLDRRLHGELTTSAELYDNAGGDARRPGQTWRARYTPQFTLPGGVSVSSNILLSNEGSELRQNINQAGFAPRWRWGAASLGDFSRPQSAYTTQGLRVRGVGLELAPTVGRVPLRLAVQGGRTQRAVSSYTAGPVFRRSMLAAKVGAGDEGGRFLALTFLKAKDDPNSVERALRVVDPAVLDTLVDEETAALLRPRLATFERPQENLVLGAAGQLPLLGRRLVVRGEAARAAITRDVLAPRVAEGGVGGLAGAVDRLLMPLRLSTSDDAAYTVDATYTGRRVGLRAGYEQVGAGFTSLGLGYLISDRRAYHAGGNVRGLGGRLALQAQYQHQNDNILGQLASTTNRDAVSASAALRVGARATTSLTGFVNTIANRAPVDTQVVDNRALALTSTTALVHELFGRAASTSVSYAFQRTTDGNPVRRAPAVAVHNASLGVQVAATPAVTLSPSLSAVLTQTANAGDQRNLFAGFRGQARALGGRLRAGGDVTHTFAAGRKVFGLRARGSYALPLDARLEVQARQTHYAAFRTRPAFRESFLTTGVTRSF